MLTVNKFVAALDGERIGEIGQQLAKFLAKLLF